MRMLSIIGSCLLAASLASGCDWSASAGGGDDVAGADPAKAAKGRVVHHASAGGPDMCEAIGEPTGCDASYAFGVNMQEDGTVRGQWTDPFKSPKGSVHVDVDCMKVFELPPEIGGMAVILGGVIKSGSSDGIDITGMPAVTAAADLRDAVYDTPDHITWTYVGSRAPVACENAEIGDIGLFEWFPLEHGQVTIW